MFHGQPSIHIIFQSDVIASISTCCVLMVAIEEVTTEALSLPSGERLLDAEELETLLPSIQRPSAKLHLTNVIQKLRKEAEALKRVEKSKAAVVDNSTMVAENPDPEAHREPPSAPAADPSSSPASKAAGPPVLASGALYTPIDKFSFDLGGYGSEFLTLYVPIEGIHDLSRDQVSCHFTPQSFDLIVKGKEKSYRLFKENLEHDIDDAKSKFIVKSTKVIVKLAKKKQEYGGYEYWSKLVETKQKKSKKADPSASIMELMKDMYDQGDDQMKKMIGETMMKQQRGELGKDPSLPSMDDF